MPRYRDKDILGNMKLYRVWGDMKTRCYNKKSTDYPFYGARGITVSKEWMDFKSFLHDMKDGYKEGLTIDRIDSNGNYSKENCKWATMKEQCNNRRSNRFITYNNQTRTLGQWSEILGIKRTTISMRIDAYGWSLERALTN